MFIYILEEDICQMRTLYTFICLFISKETTLILCIAGSIIIYIDKYCIFSLTFQWANIKRHDI